MDVYLSRDQTSPNIYPTQKRLFLKFIAHVDLVLRPICFMVFVLTPPGQYTSYLNLCLLVFDL